MSIFWILLIVIIIISYIITQKDKNKIDDILKSLALENNGQIKKVFGYYSQLMISYKDIDILISSLSSNGDRPPQTFAQFSLPNSKKIEIDKSMEEEIKLLYKNYAIKIDIDDMNIFNITIYAILTDKQEYENLYNMCKSFYDKIISIK